MNDTSQAAEEFFHRKLMEHSSEERFVMGAQMFDSARRLVLASFPEGISSAECLYNLFLRFYGWDFDRPMQARIKRRIFETVQ